MLIPPDAPTKARTVQASLYKTIGEDGTFSFPLPFQEEDFFGVAEKFKVSPRGMARAANQSLGEAWAANLSALARRAYENGKSLPTQADVDALIERYNYLGTRTLKPTPSRRDQLIAREATQLLRQILQTYGYPPDNLPAPVTVAKPQAPAGAGQITAETFENEIRSLTEGGHPWSTDPALREAREGMLSKVDAILATEDQVFRALSAAFSTESQAAAA